jgi:hypothetical protein
VPLGKIKKHTTPGPATFFQLVNLALNSFGEEPGNNGDWVSKYVHLILYDGPHRRSTEEGLGSICTSSLFCLEPAAREQDNRLATLWRHNSPSQEAELVWNRMRVLD